MSFLESIENIRVREESIKQGQRQEFQVEYSH